MESAIYIYRRIKPSKTLENYNTIKRIVWRRKILIVAEGKGKLFVV